MSKDTLVETIKRFGVTKVRDLGILCNNIPFIDDKISVAEEKQQVEVAPGLYLNTHTNTETKASQILKIAKQLGIEVKVELVDKETGASSEVNLASGTLSLGGRRSQFEVRVILPDGRVFANNFVADTLQEVVEYAGVENVKKLNINASGIPLISTTLHDRYFKNQRTLSNGMYLMTNTSTETKIKQMQQISDAYSLELKIETM